MKHKEESRKIDYLNVSCVVFYWCIAPDKNPENIRVETSKPHEMNMTWEVIFFKKCYAQNYCDSRCRKMGNHDYDSMKNDLSS